MLHRPPEFTRLLRTYPTREPETDARRSVHRHQPPQFLKPVLDEGEFQQTPGQLHVFSMDQAQSSAAISFSASVRALTLRDDTFGTCLRTYQPGHALRSQLSSLTIRAALDPRKASTDPPRPCRFLAGLCTEVGAEMCAGCWGRRAPNTARRLCVYRRRSPPRFANQRPRVDRTCR